DRERLHRRIAEMLPHRLPGSGRGEVPTPCARVHAGSADSRGDQAIIENGEAGYAGVWRKCAERLPVLRERIPARDALVGPEAAGCIQLTRMHERSADFGVAEWLPTTAIPLRDILRNNPTHRRKRAGHDESVV